MVLCENHARRAHTFHRACKTPGTQYITTDGYRRSNQISKDTSTTSVREAIKMFTNMLQTYKKGTLYAVCGSIGTKNHK